ncbi:hypothetical protein GLOIN_2v1789518 [Rhizophagus irregularis DAOM 181602=DAOM 197198]|uniref:Uncharacterized protein n=2 Tax=Rhizophagus irregularis (strain DAOM 181602 / DAOM 197198 / MUCL 43194) TaxID=747089 RepID=A0A2P4P159_RHIID|nr:hypothetical protein GLOIN_2v1789518 [Rhizophagus irregularis DAOM 181602=DAOM 197198]POG59125.1 hypothetical protein GLOIN_2v1789518 [Rhizophagus irregularis DAOM 181602=DAOM 197198]|eukprot:XP_025165991.1 hypothetical protein GLOIN_2v1789518 [Rhizophagus irregularis DAOM 181602=DAOM 197198]
MVEIADPSFGIREYEMFKQNLAKQTLRNIRLHHAQSDESISNTDICYENMMRFKKFADSLNYNGPVATMTDNTKLKESLSYSATLGCVIGSTLSVSETKVSNYEEVITIIDKIKVENTIAKQVQIYLLQIPLPKIPPIVIGLIPNNNKEKAADIFAYHQKVLQYAAQLKINIVSFGSDGAANEFNAQLMLMSTSTTENIIFEDQLYNIKFKCPVFPGIGPEIRTGIARYDQILTLTFLEQVYDQNGSQDPNKHGLFIYLFVIGELIDAYQNHTISHKEKCRMVMLAYFFLYMWNNHIEQIQKDHPDIIDIRKNFLAPQTFKILISLAESLILLILAYRDYYPTVPLCTWIHSSELYEHFFGLTKIYSEKTSAEGYIVNYYEDTIADNIGNLLAYPTNEEMHLIIHESHEQAIAFAQILEFVGYNYENLNQDDDKMEKADNSESDEISKAADLVNICNINIFNSGDDDNLIIKQSQAEINLMYNQSDKIITQDDETTFQTGIILSSGKLDIKILVLQRRKHESYSSQRMERIQVTQRFQTELNFNPNKVNNIIALNQNNGARSRILRVKRWQSRNRLETLERILHAPALPRICVANITPEDPAKSGGYAFALLGSKIYLVRFLAIYRQSSNYYSYVDDNVTCIDSLSYISVCVYEERVPNIFGCFSIASPKYILYSHISSNSIIYYLGNCETCKENMGFIIVGKREMEIYNFFNSVKDKLQLILNK